MAQESVITEEMRSLIGVESEPSTFVIEKEPIRRWAEAIGTPNPLYRDEDYAKKSRYGEIITPPGFVGNYSFPIKVGGPPPRVQSPFWRVFNGGNEYEFLKPVRAGDVLTSTTKLADLYERQGRPGIGRMLFQVLETTYKNQKGEVVVKTRGTGISYEGPTE